MEWRLIIPGYFWLILVLDLVLRVAGNAEGDALIALKNSLADPNKVLQSWDATFSTPCTWFHVTCNINKSVTRIDLGNANLSGQLVMQLDQLPNLQYLELYSNNITGEIPEQLGNLTELLSLDLYSNNLSGPIPSSLGRLKKLRFLLLNNNSLSGEIPMSLTTVSALQVLDLSNNLLTGDIPVNGSFSLFTATSFANTKLMFLPPSLPPPSPSETKLKPLPSSSLPSMQKTQGDALIALKNSLADPNNVLQSWNATLSTPCTWFHVTCNINKSVTRIDLGYANLSGQLVMQLDQLPNLQYLELFGNNITGRIPEQLGNLTELVSINLYLNNLSGPMPSSLGRLKNLRVLRLNNNSLSGEIPMSLTTVSTLRVLDLSNNPLTGDIPVNGSFPFFTPISFANTKLNPIPVLSPPPSPSETKLKPPPSSSLPSMQTTSGGKITGAIAGGVLAGAALLVTALAGGIVCARRRRKAFFAQKVHMGLSKTFSLRELQVASSNFSNKNILGGGGFGKVYKGRLTDGSLVAIKRLKEDRFQRVELQFQTEVELISVAVHRNVLWLRGYCVTRTERLLVYPYMVNNSVASCLRERPESQPPLDWPKRQRIALGSARGLAYLHDHCNPKIIHRDVKASNILLDKDFEAVIGDFGLAKLMDLNDTHVTTKVRGTIGHIAPEYLSSGKSSAKTDVFGYGVMLLELITGQKAFDLSRLAREDGVMLLEWVNGLLKEKMLEALVDVDLEGNYVGEEVEQLIQVALLCTQISPKERPKMSEVVKMLEGDGSADRWEEWQKQEMSRQDFNYQTLDQLNIGWTIGDSTYHIENKCLLSQDKTQT